MALNNTSKKRTAPSRALNTLNLLRKPKGHTYNIQPGMTMKKILSMNRAPHKNPLLRKSIGTYFNPFIGLKRSVYMGTPNAVIRKTLVKLANIKFPKSKYFVQSIPKYIHTPAVYHKTPFNMMTKKQMSSTLKKMRDVYYTSLRRPLKK